jgi:hypothetical protein
MRLFDLKEAKYFCTAPTVGGTTIGSQSLPGFHASLQGVSLLAEGSGYFEIHRANVLDDSERWILFALSNYRRALDMLVPAAAPWGQVTLYYSAFFAANAILGMFGGWAGHLPDGRRFVEVVRGSPGSQELRIHRKLTFATGARGSHTQFWEFFYNATASIAPWAPKALSSALLPVNGNPDWQIVERNRINYDMFHAWSASKSFYRTFKPSRLKSLTGALGQQLDATERLVELALHFAKATSLSRVALDGCGPTGPRTVIQRRLLSPKKAPRLQGQSKVETFLGI